MNICTGTSLIHGISGYWRALNKTPYAFVLIAAAVYQNDGSRAERPRKTTRRMPSHLVALQVRVMPIRYTASGRRVD